VVYDKDGSGSWTAGPCWLRHNRSPTRHGRYGDVAREWGPVRSPSRGGKAVSRTPSGLQERRRFPRSVVEIPIQAVRRRVLTEDPRRLIGLHVLNISRSGVGAMAQEPLEERESLMLFFPPIGSGRGHDTPAEVVRCAISGGRCSVGIAFEQPWPAEGNIHTAGRGGEQK